MALPKKQWDKLVHDPKIIEQEREWRRLNSPSFQFRELPTVGIILPVDCNPSEDIKKRVAAIIHPKLPISP